MSSSSHPPSLVTLVRGCLERECALGPAPRILLGVSGGLDSTALAHVLASLRAPLGLELAVVTIDHGLRPAAREEAAHVEATMRALEVPCEVHRLALAPGSNLQERAREARRELLAERSRALHGAGGFIATAHHADDRAETVLLRLLRGVSLEGLGALPPRDGQWLRPMIRARRADVRAHAERHGLAWHEDPSNRDPRFLRVRVRTEVLPQLEELGPGIVDSLTRLADEAHGHGDASLLNREQRRQLALALREPARRVDVPLPGGLRLTRGGAKR